MSRKQIGLAVVLAIAILFPIVRFACNAYSRAYDFRCEIVTFRVMATMRSYIDEHHEWPKSSVELGIDKYISEFVTVNYDIKLGDIDKDNDLIYKSILPRHGKFKYNQSNLQYESLLETIEIAKHEKRRKLE